MVSIIMPVYNAAEYLDNTVKCILNQSFRDFELLLIDDGSTDGSANLCDLFASLDSRIKIVHVENGGPSSARNQGLHRAIGEYVTFIDADDSFSNDYLEKLVEDFYRANCPDLVIQGMVQKWPDKTIKFALKDRIFNLEGTDFDSFFEQVYLNDFSGPYCKLFKSSIIRERNLRFSQDIIYGEDFDFLLRYLGGCNVVSTSSATNYIYMMHSGSVSAKIYPFPQELSGIRQLMNSFIDLLRRFDRNSLRTMMIDSITAYFWRIIGANYKFGYSRGQRIKNFRSLPPEVVGFFQENFIATTAFTTAIKILLRHNKYGILDSMLKLRLSLSKK